MAYKIKILILFIIISPLLGIYFVKKISEKNDKYLRLTGIMFSLTVFFLSSWLLLLYTFNAIPPFTIFEIYNYNIKCEVKNLLRLESITFYTFLINGYFCYVCALSDDELQETLTFFFCLEFILILLVLFFSHS
jgi:NADH:ubiquinone oxidoreductase subunit 4 (subunit M)